MDIPKALFRTEAQDPFALGKFRSYTKKLQIASWLFLLMSISFWIDAKTIQKMPPERISEIQDKLEYRSSGGKYSSRSIPVSYFVIKTANQEVRTPLYVVNDLNIKVNDTLFYWRTPIYHQWLKLGNQNNYYNYRPLIFEMPYLFYIQLISTLLGILFFIPGQIRLTAIVCSGLTTFFLWMIL